MTVFAQILTLLRKEVLLELRQKNAIFSLVLYIVGTVFLCYMAFHLKTQALTSITWNTLFWIILLFVSINTIGKSFIAENSSRHYYYYYTVSPTAFVFSKMIYNVLLMAIMAFLTYGFMSTVLHIDIGDKQMFMLNLFFGAIGFSCVLTMVSAIAGQTANPILMAIMSFPVILPLLLILIRVSSAAIDGLSRSIVMDDLIALAGINVIVVVVTYLLYPYLWRA